MICECCEKTYGVYEGKGTCAACKQWLSDQADAQLDDTADMIEEAVECEKARQQMRRLPAAGRRMVAMLALEEGIIDIQVERGARVITPA